MQCNLKNDRMISLRFQGKPFNITVIIQVYASTTTAEEAEVDQFYEDLEYLLELTSKKRSPSHHRGLECKSRKSRGTWCNRQVWPWRTKWNRAKTNWILPRECIGHSKYPFSTTQEMTLHIDEHHRMTNTEIKCIHIRQYIKTIGWLRVIRVEIGQERRWIL